MANRPKGYGFTADVHNKKAGKFNRDEAQEAVDWVMTVAGASKVSINSPEDVQTALKGGQELCQVLNKIKPGAVKKIHDSQLAFRQMENIGNFSDGVGEYGVVKVHLFQSVDLYEGGNIPQVINTIYALARMAQKNGASVPPLGPKEADLSPRSFSESTLKAGEGHIGLQAGTNKFASQAGQNFGKTRAIID